MNTDPRLYTPSGLNNQFMDEGLSFADYIAHCQTIILQARADIKPENQEKIISANSPFQWIPKQFFIPNTLTPAPSSPSSGRKKVKGVLLIHGLYDSPFLMHDIAAYFLAKNFLVYAVLLPGHGTVPGDLLNIQYREWIKVVDYAVQQLRLHVEEIYLGGFSTGGILAINHAARLAPISGLILFAPAMKLRAEPLLPFALPALNLIARINKGALWYHKAPQLDYVKYNSFTCNSVDQVHQLIKQTQSLITTACFEMPLFLVAALSDELIHFPAISNFFKLNHHPGSRFIIYGHEINYSQEHRQLTRLRTLISRCRQNWNTQLLDDSRILVRSSDFPEENILDFSHTCLTISPNNPHYGRQGDYEDFQHYHGSQPTSGEVFKGAINHKNLNKKIVLQRLTYNPDFEYMMDKLREFLEAE